MKRFVLAVYQAIKKGLRILCWSVALVIVLASALCASLYFFLTPELVESRIQTVLKDTDAVLTYAKPEVRVLPRLTVTLPDVTWANQDGTPVANAKTLRLRIAYPWLIFNEIRIVRAEVLDAALAQDVTAKDIAERLSRKSAATAIVPGVTVEKLQISGLKADYVTTDGKRLNARFNQIALTEVSPQMHSPVTFDVSLKDEASTFAIEGLGEATFDLDLTDGLALFSHGTINLKGSIAETPLSSQASFSEIRILPEATVVTDFSSETELGKKHLSLGIAEGRVTPDIFSGVVSAKYTKGEESFKTEAEVRASLKVNAQSVSATNAEGSVRFPNSEPVAFEATFTYEPEVQSLKGRLAASIHEQSASFEGTLLFTDTLDAKGKLAFSEIAPENIFSEVLSAANDSVKALIADFKTLWTTEQATSEDFSEKNDVLPAELVPGRKDAGTVSNTSRWSFDINFEGEMQADTLRVANLKLSRFKGQASLTSAGLTLKAGQGVFYDAAASLEATLNPMLDWSLKLKTVGANYAAMARDLGAERLYPGRLTLQTDIYGNGLDAGNINGQIGFLLHLTRLYGVDLSHQLATSQDTPDASLFTEVSRLQSLVTVVQSEAQAEHLVIETSAGRFSGSAALNLLTKRIDGSLSSTIGLSRAKMRLSGSWLEPLASVSSTSLLPQAPAVPEEKAPKEETPAKPAEPPASGWQKFKNYLKDLF